MCALLAEFYVNLLSDQLLVSANLQIVLISYRNIGKIPYQCINKIDAIWPYEIFEWIEPTTLHPSPRACSINYPVK